MRWLTVVLFSVSACGHASPVAQAAGVPQNQAPLAPAAPAAAVGSLTATELPPIPNSMASRALGASLSRGKMQPAALGLSGLELVVQRPHARGIHGVEFLPEELGFVDCSEDQTLHVRKLDGRLIRVIDIGFAPWAMALSPDGQSIAVAGQSPDVKAFRLSDGKLLRIYVGNKGAVSGLGFTRDGKYLVSGNAYNEGIIWRTSGDLVARLKGHQAAIEVAVTSPDSKLIATGDEQGEVRLWDLQGNAVRNFRVNQGPIMDMAFGPSGQVLSVAMRRSSPYGQTHRETGTVGLRLFDLYGKHLRTIAEKEILGIRYARDGKLVGAGSGEVNLWDTAGKLLRTYRASGQPREEPSGVDISSDGKRIVAVSWDLPATNLWSIEGNLQTQIAGQSAELSSVAYAPDGTLLAIGDWRGRVALWSATGKLVAALDGGSQSIVDLEFSSDSQHLASAGSAVRVFSRRGVLERTMGAPASGDFLSAMAYAPNGREIVCGHFDGSLEYFDVATGASTRRIRKAHESRVESLAVSHDGTELVSGAAFGNLVIRNWDGSNPRKLNGHEAYAFVSKVAFSPDDTQIASAAARTILLHRRDGSLLRRIATSHRTSNVNSVAFSSDGKYIAGPENADVRIWDLGTQESRVFAGHSASVQAVAFDPTGLRLVSVAGDSSARLWSLTKPSSWVLVSNENDWVNVADDGFFDASPHGGGLVAMANGFEAWAVDQFAPYTNRPDVLLTRMGFGNVDMIEHYRRQHERRLRLLGLEATGGRMPTAVPEAKIVRTQSAGKVANLSVWCRDSRVGLGRYDVYVNDVPVTSQARALSGKEKTLDSQIELGQGTNKVEVSCTNAAGIESYRALTYFRYDQPVRGELYFLGLGVSRYQDPTLALKYAERDARELGARFAQMSEGFAQVHIKMLTDGDCTVPNLRLAKEWLKQSKTDDTVVLFVAGHGLHDTDTEETYYFLTHEADLKHLSSTAAPYDLLEEILAAPPARHKLALLDTCESGELTEDTWGTVALTKLDSNISSRGFRRTAQVSPARTYGFERDRYVYNSLLRRSGAIVLSSSRGSEASYESDELRHGFFTYAILRGLSEAKTDADGDGSVSTEELAKYVSEIVPKLSQKLQQPTLDRDNLSQRFGFPRGGAHDNPGPGSAPLGGTSRNGLTPTSSQVPGPSSNDEARKSDQVAKQAVASGSLEIVKRLVPSKVSANWKSQDGWSLVMTAALIGRTEVLRYLLELRADPNTALESGYTTLMQACRGGYLESTKLLIAAGADVNRGEGSRAGTPLHITISEAKGNLEIVRLLLEHHASVAARNAQRQSPLMLAAGAGQVEVVSLLLAKKPDVGLEDPMGDTALDWAARRGNTEIIRVLLGAGANVKHKNTSQMTALFQAAHAGASESVKLLLDRGADPNPIETKYGDSALMRAAQSNREQVVHLLLTHGAKPNLKNREGMTAIHLAARNGYEPIVRLLLARGADRRAVNGQGKDAASLAADRGRSNIAALIRQGR